MDFEAHLKATFEKFLDRSDGKVPPNLAESMAYSLLSPGKRIRPRLMLTCGAMLGLKASELIPAAISLEMIHCFTLIHDDLPCMDDDDFRRGRPSNHKQFGEALALLAGDALLSLAFDVFLESPVSPLRLKEGLKHLCWASGPRGVIGGQAAEALLHSQSSFDELKAMHLQKTGALFQAAILIPAAFAEVPHASPQDQALKVFSECLGFAFQIADDLEDAGGSSQGAQDPSKDPRSILSHFSFEQAQAWIRENLRPATDELKRLWLDQSLGLVTISDEVIRKSLL
ncbi:MAG: polyprenyl synthetase family protein [Bdellovibrionia bacterium]